MSNEEISDALIKKFGLKQTIIFSKMASLMFDMLHQNIIKHDPDNLCNYGYDYDRDWWSKRFDGWTAI